MIRRFKLFLLIAILISSFALGTVFSKFDFFKKNVPKANLEATSDFEASSNMQQEKEFPVQSLVGLSQTFVNIAQEANQTVVTVFTEKTFKVPSIFFKDQFKDFFRIPDDSKEREYSQQGLGSGVIVSENGYILTNHHVIEGANKIQVRLMNKKTLEAKVIGTDPKTDIAVLKVEMEKLPAIKIGDSDQLQVGEIVMAIGSPMSQNLAHTITHGIVSAKGRSNVGVTEYEDFIQTDAAINPGNSGGALVNLDGELVGINTAIASRNGGFEGIGFAVPINLAKNIMKDLIEHGTVTRGWLGVYIQDINEDMAKAMNLPFTDGVLVSDISNDGPADKAGIIQGDVILELNGKKMLDTKLLRNEVAAISPDTEVAVKLFRDGKERLLKVKLGRLGSNELEQQSGA